jgi:hypothetical protein
MMVAVGVMALALATVVPVAARDPPPEADPGFRRCTT